MEPSANTNDDTILAWNTVLYDKFVRFRHLVTDVAAHGHEALRRHPPRRGGRALDIGCGFGDTTVELASLVGANGEAVGVDAAASFIDGARRDERSSGADNLRFFTADVQSAPLGGPYDFAFSRFGTMFFASPVAALRNVRRALAPGGRLVMVVWRRREDNPWLHTAEQRVRSLVPENGDSDAPTCGPGPFSMASPDVVAAQLQAAGFDRIAFERFDTDICIGRDLDEAVEFAMALGPAGELLRLAGPAATPLRPRVLAALRDALSAFAGPTGVHAASSVWIVSAVAPPGPPAHPFRSPEPSARPDPRTPAFVAGDRLPEIRAPRVALRWLEDTDTGDLFRIYSDPAAMAYWSTTPMRDPKEAERLIADIRRMFAEHSLYEWGVVRLSDGRTIGTLTFSSLDPRNRRAEIGFALARDVWRQGYMHEAVTAALEFAFEKMGLRRIEADVDPRNTAALRLLEKIGFRREGLLHERWRVGGHTQDSVILGLLRRQWTGSGSDA